MPYSYRIFPDLRLVISRGNGVVTAEELQRHARALGSDPRHHRDFRQLVDLTAVSEIRVPGSELPAVDRRIIPFNPDARRALVAPDDLAFGTVRIVLARGALSPEHATVVRSMADACAFLGLRRAEPWLTLAREAPDWSLESESVAREDGPRTPGTSPVDRPAAPARRERGSAPGAHNGR